MYYISCSIITYDSFRALLTINYCTVLGPWKFLTINFVLQFQKVRFSPSVEVAASQQKVSRTYCQSVASYWLSNHKRSKSSHNRLLASRRYFQLCLQNRADNLDRGTVSARYRDGLEETAMPGKFELYWKGVNTFRFCFYLLGITAESIEWPVHSFA